MPLQRRKLQRLLKYQAEKERNKLPNVECGKTLLHYAWQWLFVYVVGNCLIAVSYYQSHNIYFYKLSSDFWGNLTVCYLTPRLLKPSPVKKTSKPVFLNLFVSVPTFTFKQIGCPTISGVYLGLRRRGSKTLLKLNLEFRRLSISLKIRLAQKR